MTAASLSTLLLPGIMLRQRASISEVLMNGSNYRALGKDATDEMPYGTPAARGSAVFSPRKAVRVLQGRYEAWRGREIERERRHRIRIDEAQCVVAETRRSTAAASRSRQLLPPASPPPSSPSDLAKNPNFLKHSCCGSHLLVIFVLNTP
jgi:hypothetical protein